MPPEQPTDQPRRSRLRAVGLELVGIIVVVAVAATAGAFAHAFRQTMYWAMHVLSGVRSASGSIRANAWWHAGVIVSGAVTLGLTIGLLARRWRGERLGISALSERTRGTGPGPSLRATLLQALGILARTGAPKLPWSSPQAQHLAIESLKLAFVDTYRALADPASMDESPQDWLRPELFRFGASGLLGDLLMQRQKLRTGAYSGPDYISVD